MDCRSSSDGEVRKMIYRTILKLALATACLQAFGQTHSVPPWPQEPSALLGIQLGQPLIQSIPVCPQIDTYGLKRYEWVGVDHQCSEPISDFFVIHNTKMFKGVYVRQVDGKVGSISASFRASEADQISEAMIDKFGPAHLVKVEDVQNRMGATFEDHVLTWKGSNVVLTFDSIGSEVDEGLVTISTASYLDKQTKEKAQQKDSVKGIL